MIYEVYIPALDKDGYDVTLKIEADNWMMALKSGLIKTGQADDIIRNVMCDIKQDNSIHVTDAMSRRVFVLREVEEVESQATQKMESLEPAKTQPSIAVPKSEDFNRVNTDKTHQLTAEPSRLTERLPTEPAKPSVVVEPMVAQTPQAPAPKPAPAVAVQQPVEAKPPTSTNPFVEEASGRVRIGSQTMKALRRDEPDPVVLEERRSPTGERPAISNRRPERVGDNIMEEVFLEINRIHDGEMSMEEVVNFVMDLAMEKVGAEAGSIMFADINGTELYFATARGPKAADIMSFRIPMGTGVAGFCAREGVSLAISDAPNDPRFYKAISDALGYPTKSLCCAPIQFEGRVFGAIELLNSADNHFNSTEVNVLTYVGKQLARYVNDLIMASERLE